MTQRDPVEQANQQRPMTTAELVSHRPVRNGERQLSLDTDVRVPDRAWTGN